MANTDNKNLVENRISKRNLLRLSASFSATHSEQTQCIICDFCEEGMFFTFGEGLSEAQIGRDCEQRIGSSAIIEFRHQGSSYTFEGAVVRELENAIAIKFLDNTKSN
ncbi:MAG: hypothetical protein JKY67_14595 [Pseudomonadales bacterium]|nr:hypothetical protein [Pseudomonadales bacterium]